MNDYVCIALYLRRNVWHEGSGLLTDMYVNGDWCVMVQQGGEMLNSRIWREPGSCAVADFSPTTSYRGYD